MSLDLEVLLFVNPGSHFPMLPLQGFTGSSLKQLISINKDFF